MVQNNKGITEQSTLLEECTAKGQSTNGPTECCFCNVIKYFRKKKIPFIHLFIHSFNQCLESIYCVPVPVQDTGNMKMNSYDFLFKKSRIEHFD